MRAIDSSSMLVGGILAVYMMLEFRGVQDKGSDQVLEQALRSNFSAAINVAVFGTGGGRLKLSEQRKDVCLLEWGDMINLS